MIHIVDPFYESICDCINSYSGTRCEISPCDSHPNPCYNASQCVMSGNSSISCGVCPVGKIGDARGVNGCQGSFNFKTVSIS